MTTVPTTTPAAGELATAATAGMPGDGSLTGIPLSAYPYQVAGHQYTEWLYTQLDGDGTGPAILLSCPPEASQDGEIKLTPAEAIRLAGALLSLACQAGHDVAYAAGDPSPCCPGEELQASQQPAVWCPECGSKYTEYPGEPHPVS